jgi:hypothetical protein
MRVQFLAEGRATARHESMEPRPGRRHLWHVMLYDCDHRAVPSQLQVAPKYPSLPLSSIMSVDEPFNIYREQLSSRYHGLALWDPTPVENLYKQPGHVSIGDVGYLDNGAFMRMFNVTIPWDDPSNKLLGEPGKYEIIEPSYFGNVRDTEIREGEYCAPHVSKVDNIAADSHEE